MGGKADGKNYTAIFVPKYAKWGIRSARQRRPLIPSDVPLCPTVRFALFSFPSSLFFRLFLPPPLHSFSWPGLSDTRHSQGGSQGTEWVGEEGFWPHGPATVIALHHCLNYDLQEWECVRVTARRIKTRRLRIPRPIINHHCSQLFNQCGIPSTDV